MSISMYNLGSRAAAGKVIVIRFSSTLKLLLYMDATPPFHIQVFQKSVILEYDIDSLNKQYVFGG
jgi:hypothetical protein